MTQGLFTHQEIVSRHKQAIDENNGSIIFGLASFAEGMAPKVQACLDAIAAGARAVRIIDGTNPSALKDALLGMGGTLVVA